MILVTLSRLVASIPRMFCATEPFVSYDKLRMVLLNPASISFFKTSQGTDHY